MRSFIPNSWAISGFRAPCKSRAATCSSRAVKFSIARVCHTLSGLSSYFSEKLDKLVRFCIIVRMVLLHNGSPLGQESSFCFYCGRPIRHIPFVPGRNPPADALTIDHVIPKAKGGERGPKVFCCIEHNRDKNSLTLDEYRVVCAYRAGLVPLPAYKFAAEERA